ncbi:MAG: hypothetical protein L6247_09005 [Desulfobacteraceae bacterium]|nr:hypothetical protein [Desulfobacteraceae bacterium]
MFKKKDKQITIFNNGKIFFVTYDKNKNFSVIDSHSIDNFLSDSFKIEDINEDARYKINSLLIVPDYWFGNNTYVFQSKKKSLVEEFIKRKLTSEHSDLPYIKYFFDYISYETEQKEREIYVYFLQEPDSFSLHKKLVEFDINPRRITTPALLWEQKLKKNIPDFHEGGKAFAHLLSSECFLCFFLHGRFLFSRSINLPASRDNLSEKLTTLTYEINQSIYLFSQKAKADIDQFFLLSSGEKDSQELSKLLGRDIKELSSLDADLKAVPKLPESLDFISPFSVADIGPLSKYPYLSHRSLKQELDWKPVQVVGMVIGIILILLLSVESFILWKWHKSANPWIPESSMIADIDLQQIIQEYNDALDMFLKETERISIRENLVKIAKSLPDNVLIEEIAIDVDTNPSVNLKGVIRATEPDSFKYYLSLLLNRLHEHIQGSRSVRMQDVDFKLNEASGTGLEYQNYSFKLKFNLP